MYIYLNSLIHMHIHSPHTYTHMHSLIHMLTHAHTNTHRETWSCFFPVHNLEVLLTTTYTKSL